MGVGTGGGGASGAEPPPICQLGGGLSLPEKKKPTSPPVHLKDGRSNYLSPGIINEIIKFLRNTILREILQEVKEAKWFTIMADETRDITNQEQLVVCICWVHKTYKVCEDPIGLVSIPKTAWWYDNPHGPKRYLNEVWPSSGTLSEPVIRWSIHYDGSCECCGCTDPEISSYCFTHPLRSTLSEPCAAGGWKKVTPIGDALNCTPYQMVSKARSLFSWKTVECSYGGWLQWHSDSKPKYPSPLSYQVDSAHWCHHCCATNYEMLQETFEDTHKSTHDQTGITAGGMVSPMDKFSTFFSLMLSHHVFGPAELAFKALQAVGLNSQEEWLVLNTAKNLLSGPEGPCSIWGHVPWDSGTGPGENWRAQTTIDRRRSRDRRFLKDSDLPTAQFHTPKAFHRQEFLTAVKLLEKEVERRTE